MSSHAPVDLPTFAPGLRRRPGSGLDAQTLPPQMNNGEANSPVLSYSKGLRHNALGEADPASFQSLLTAVGAPTPENFERIILGPGGTRLTDPQAGLTVANEGPDPLDVTMPPAPTVGSAQTAGEMGELYWMAVARDVHFNAYGSNDLITAAVAGLNADFSDFRGPRENGFVTPRTVFRGSLPGETVGPYVSQFLLRGTADPRRPAGQGRDVQDGIISYGEQRINQRQLTVQAGPGFTADFLTDFNFWLSAQNGVDLAGRETYDPQRRFIRNLRDLATYVHYDFVLQAFYNACVLLLSDRDGIGVNDPRTGTFALDPGNPFRGSHTQMGFSNWGPLHVLPLVADVARRALNAVWYQKWFVHRRLRPEELGGRIDVQLRGLATYGISSEIVSSLWDKALAPFYGQPGDRFRSYLLPQAYSEGAPTHPSYGSGHAVVAGACATVLKAFFTDGPYTAAAVPLVANADGTALQTYNGGDAAQMTISGEINKLAGNISIGRLAAGVHYRSDSDQALLLGEQIALLLLRDHSAFSNLREVGSFTVDRFNGTRVVIQNGVIGEGPFLVFSPAGGLPTDAASRSVSIRAIDEEGMTTGVTRTLLLNGTDVAGTFTPSLPNPQTLELANSAVPLQPGANVLRARVCDPQGNCTTAIANYPRPAAQAGAPKVWYNTSVHQHPEYGLTLYATDEDDLLFQEAGGYSVILNEAVITTDFYPLRNAQYHQGGHALTIHSLPPWQQGSNTVTWTVYNQAGQFGTITFTVQYPAV